MVKYWSGPGSGSGYRLENWYILKSCFFNIKHEQ